LLKFRCSVLVLEFSIEIGALSCEVLNNHASYFGPNIMLSIISVLDPFAIPLFLLNGINIYENDFTVFCGE